MPSIQSSQAWVLLWCLCASWVSASLVSDSDSGSNGKDPVTDSFSGRSRGGNVNHHMPSESGSNFHRHGKSSGSSTNPHDPSDSDSSLMDSMRASNSDTSDRLASSDNSNNHEASGDGDIRVEPVRISLPLAHVPDNRRISVTRERNATQVMIRCPSTPPIHFLGLPSSQSFPFHYSEYDVPYDDDESYDQPDLVDEVSFDSSALVRSAEKGRRGVEVNLMELVNTGTGGPLMVDVEGCGRVGVGDGVPGWADGVTFAIKGSILLRPNWWAYGLGLKQMWVRADEGLSGVEDEASGMFQNLPPTLEGLDVSQTPLADITLDQASAPKNLQSLVATRSGLSRLSLCTPSLVYLHVSTNGLGGDLEDWVGCENGTVGVQYLKASHDLLQSVSVHSYPSLVSLEIVGNLLVSLNLSSAHNLNLLSAAHNNITNPLALPPNLQKLDLNHNRLLEIPELTAELQDVDLSHNQIGRVGKGRFKRSRKLERLNLAHNHITELYERELMGLRHLHTLDLSHNRLRLVAPSALLPLHHLRHLHLHRNHLKTLDSRTLSSLPPDTHALLHHNPWGCTCGLLWALTKLARCKDCGHKRVPLECVEGGLKVSVNEVLQTCRKAVQKVTQPLNDESDEDLSEEIEDDPIDGSGSKNPGVMMVVPGLVVILLAGVIVALGYRLYHRHRRSIATRLAPFCGFCGYCAPTSVNNNHENNHHHHRRDPLSQIENDSDTETEL